MLSDAQDIGNRISELLDCVIRENIHTSPTEGIFSKTSPPLWKFQLSFIHFFKFFGLIESPTPQEIPILSVRGVWIFSGTAHFMPPDPPKGKGPCSPLSGHIHLVHLQWQHITKVIETPAFCLFTAISELSCKSIEYFPPEVVRRKQV